jgi:type II secretory pathway component PulM
MAKQYIAAPQVVADALYESVESPFEDVTLTSAAVTGTLTGSVDGALADIADIALDTSNTYTDAAVNSAVNTAIAAANLQIKELQTALNKAIVDIAALHAALGGAA